MATTKIIIDTVTEFIDGPITKSKQLKAKQRLGIGPNNKFTTEFQREVANQLNIKNGTNLKQSDISPKSGYIKKDVGEKNYGHSKDTIQKIAEKRRANPKSNFKSKKDPGANRKYTPNMNSPIKRFFDKYLGPDYKEYELGIRELIEQKLRQIKTKMAKDKVPNYEIIFRESIKDPEAMIKAYPNLLDEILPFRSKAQNFMEGPYRELSTSQTYKKQLYDYMKSRGMSHDEIMTAFPKSFATVGHIPGTALNYSDFLKTGNKSALQNFEQSATPKFWNPEFGVINAGKDTIDRWVLNALQDGSMSKEGMRQIENMYTKLGLQSRLRNYNFGNLDLDKQAGFIDYGASTGNKLFTGPGKEGTAKTKEMFERMTRDGDITFEEILEQVNKRSFSGGGLAKLLNKLKLTKKQKELIKRTAFNEKNKPGTGPKALREERIKKKIREKYGKEKKWKYVKSEIEGPKSSLQRKKEKEFFEHTEFWPDKKKKAKGGIVSLYVR